MFSFTKLIAVASIATLAAASSSGGSCNTGPVQCCNNVQKASDPAISTLLGALGIDVSDVNAMVGVQCSPVTVVGAGGGAKCSAQPVCCENNSYGGAVAVGCAPVTL
ncbi:fungal hydrophobin [Heliocybe sulcata]|uniref:Hydrophobin n=1 Tax=Heliocybe sulcata TaxID=5364 RepID=A0A5C3N308_9AGAM|nr:fungal hydrophobin [Heliocybe sulcata]